MNGIHTRILCNSAGMKLLREAAVNVENSIQFEPLYRMPVLEDITLDFNLATVWTPPPSGRFSELGPEDEGWARPLGIGTVVETGAAVFYEIIDRYQGKLNLNFARQILGSTA